MPKKEYQGWPLLSMMPDGWVFDAAGSPLHGYMFVTNGKSPINGQKRALLRVIPPQRPLFQDRPTAAPAPMAEPDPGKPRPAIDTQYLRTVNELARQKFKQRLLNDILADLMVCEIEGWSKTEYIEEIRRLVFDVGQKACIQTNNPA